VKKDEELLPSKKHKESPSTSILSSLKITALNKSNAPCARNPITGSPPKQSVITSTTDQKKELNKLALKLDRNESSLYSIKKHTVRKNQPTKRLPVIKPVKKSDSGFTIDEEFWSGISKSVRADDSAENSAFRPLSPIVDVEREDDPNAIDCPHRINPEEYRTSYSPELRKEEFSQYPHGYDNNTTDYHFSKTPLMNGAPALRDEPSTLNVLHQRRDRPSASFYDNQIDQKIEYHGEVGGDIERIDDDASYAVGTISVSDDLDDKMDVVDGFVDPFAVPETVNFRFRPHVLY